MENESSFLWETAGSQPTEASANNGSFHDDVEDLFKGTGIILFLDMVKCFF